MPLSSIRSPVYRPTTTSKSTETCAKNSFPDKRSFGREVGRRQTADLGFSLRLVSWLDQNYTFKANYEEQNDPAQRRGVAPIDSISGLPFNTLEIRNQNDLSARLNFKIPTLLKNLGKAPGQSRKAQQRDDRDRNRNRNRNRNIDEDAPTSKESQAEQKESQAEEEKAKPSRRKTKLKAKPSRRKAKPSRRKAKPKKESQSRAEEKPKPRRKEAQKSKASRPGERPSQRGAKQSKAAARSQYPPPPRRMDWPPRRAGQRQLAAQHQLAPLQFAAAAFAFLSTRPRRHPAGAASDPRADPPRQLVAHVLV